MAESTERTSPVRRAVGGDHGVAPACRRAMRARCRRSPAPAPGRSPCGSRAAPPRRGAGASGRPGGPRRRGRARRARRGRGAIGASWTAPMTAIATARSAAGLGEPGAADGRHVDVVAGDRDAGPPLDDGEQHRQPRLPSRPLALRRPVAPCGTGTVSAWTSTSSGRCPSIAGTMTDPATPRRRSARNRCDGSGTPTRPPSVISNSPSSLVGPKRCLTARSSRSAWWRSPSNDSTVSTACSSRRGPASEPSLVTWPTRTMATPRRFASTTSCCAHARTCVAEPGATATRSSAIVWMLSMTTSSGCTRSIAVDDAARAPSRPAIHAVRQRAHRAVRHAP